MTDEPEAKVFDMPHARVTLTPVGPNVEIEVWPKMGQSAYAVVDPRVAVLIARHLLELAAAQASGASPGAVRQAEDDDAPAGDVPDNVVDLASRRAGGPPGGGRAG